MKKIPLQERFIKPEAQPPPPPPPQFLVLGMLGWHSILGCSLPYARSIQDRLVIPLRLLIA